MALLLTLILQGATTPVPVDFDLARLPRPDRLAVIRRCDAPGNPADIVVCGNRHDNRLPPIEEDPDETPDDARITRGTGMAALTPVGACGMFAGQRDCDKAEMRHFGYGRGRDPVTVVGKLAGKLFHPD